MSKKHYYGRAAAGLSFSEGVFSTTTASATGFSGRSALTTYESDEREYEREYASAIAAVVCPRGALRGAPAWQRPRRPYRTRAGRSVRRCRLTIGGGSFS